MTKHIRVENADTSDYKVSVEVWDKGIDGNPDKMERTYDLDFPTALTVVAITSTRYLTRYLVVREKPV